MRILFLADWYPYPTDNGSKLRIYGLLRGLAKNHEVTLLCFADQSGANRNSPELRSLCRNVQVVLRKSYSPNKLRAQLGFFTPTPRYISDTFSAEMAQRIQDILSEEKYDLVIASQLGTACYRKYFRGIPALFEEVELGGYYESFKSATSPWRRFRNGLTWAKHRRYVARLLGHYQGCTVVSGRERQLILQIAPAWKSLEVIPNFINLADYNNVVATPQPNSLIFTGSFRYFANHDAMVWFLQEVYPRIQEQVPEVRLTITGDHANLPLPPASGVTLTGFVGDIRSLVASSWVSLVPVRVGGGTRLKILEAMALGVPVVSTLKGAEGLELRDGEHLLIGDTNEEFAGNVLRLLRDRELHQRIVHQARALVTEKYAWDVVMPRFESLVQRIGTS